MQDTVFTILIHLFFIKIRTNCSTKKRRTSVPEIHEPVFIVKILDSTDIPEAQIPEYFFRF